MNRSPALQFHITARDAGTAARTGRLTLAHAIVETPVFMPVGTQATVKATTPEELEALDFRLILGNTYHLYLRPGAPLVEQMGGLHRFMGWSGALLTDSGGFQVFSLQDLRTITEDGVAFKSHLDGSRHLFTPESVMHIQHQLGADIIMAFDECAPGGCDRDTAAQAMQRTLRWAQRCVEAHDTPQALFGIVQGGVYPDLRRESAEATSAMGFPGLAIGGVAVGESKEQVHDIVALTTPLLPETRPRYLMGVGEPEDMLQAIGCGVDMFDCVLPTRLARNAAIVTRRGRVNLRNARHASDAQPPDPGCGCPCCRRHSMAYLHHLFVAGEILGARLATLHNLWFYTRLMAEARLAIREGRYGAFQQEFLAGYTRIAGR